MTTSPYNYTFNPTDDSTAARVIRNVGYQKYVLELGCAYGVMTKVLVEHNNCRVFGVEYDVNSAQQAEVYCENLAILDIDNANWEQVFGDERFDVIVAADVLEHLRDPQKCLVSLRKFLAPDGYLVLSIPNIAHNGIVAELLNDDFEYRKTGLLDETHLRFWGAQGIARLLTASGFVIDNIETTRIEPEQSEFADVWDFLPEWFKTTLRFRPEGNVYQYIIKAFTSEYKKDNQVIAWPSNMLLPSLVDIETRIVKAEKRASDVEAELAIYERKNADLIVFIDQIRRSFSWQLTIPLRFAGRLYRQELTDKDREYLTHILRTIYHRLPLPVPAKRLLGFTYHRVITKLLRFLGRSIFRVSAFRPPTIRPILQHRKTPDYFIWGVIDWHFRHQRPQQIALGLAETGRRVFYISPNLIDDERAGFEVEALDSKGLLFQIKLFVKGAPAVYSAIPGFESVSQLKASIGEVLEWADCKQIVSMAQHPFWCEVAAALPNSCLIYDCMDHHEGFGNTCLTLTKLEKNLFNKADLTITTSDWLDKSVANHTQRRALIRNAGEYLHFSNAPESIYQEPLGRRVIGYYGAIAEWFDVDLVEAVAKRHPECCVLLIGADSINAKSRLGKLPNVVFKGEVPYNKLPYYLYSFDLCLLPFKVIPLTLATNPVKAYEYLSAGKPVVSVDLPEMAQFGGLLYVAPDQTLFLNAVDKILARPEPGELIQRRKVFAEGQTWKHRADALIEHAEVLTLEAKVSVIVVTYNNIELTRSCLTSIDEHSHYKNLEVIVVDNASSDGSPAFLKDWVSVGNNRKLILNDDNRGFAAANNQGLNLADGEFLVLLNNDTYVTPGWIHTLVNHLKHNNSIGLIGPVTNNIGNEAKIDIHYKDMDEMLIKSAAYTRRHIGQVFPLRTAAFFCVMISREIFERVGPLDEAFGRGFFEDDDYCRRIEQLDLRVVCAEDVFVHHQLSASFNKLKQQDRQKLFEENKATYEAKWGEWVPHTYKKVGRK